MKLKHLVLPIALVTFSANADSTVDAAIGGGVGGALGAAIGNEVGGKDGAMVGGALGAAAGVAINTDGKSYPQGKTNVHVRTNTVSYSTGNFCPPGQAKKGRC